MLCYDLFYGKFPFQDCKSRNTCCVINCANYPAKHPDLGYYRFPAHSAPRQQWINKMTRDYWKPSNYTVVCSKHFSIYCFRRPPSLDKPPPPKARGCTKQCHNLSKTTPATSSNKAQGVLLVRNTPPSTEDLPTQSEH